MRSVKSRNWSKKEDDDLASIMREDQKNQKKLKWKEVAEMINLRNPNSSKNSKQCRQRWINHVCPDVKKLQNWTEQQDHLLFSIHNKIGNKWAQIAKNLPGRTDNCIKNHFYSVMRCGLRKLNSFIRNVKRKTTLVKTFNNQVLNKILVICQGKNNQRFQIFGNAQQLAQNAKRILVQISLDQNDDDEYKQQAKQQLFNFVTQFTRNCRKKKSKKVSKQKSSQEISQISQQSQQIQQNLEQQLIKQQNNQRIQSTQQKIYKKQRKKETQGTKKSSISSKETKLIESQTQIKKCNIKQPQIIQSQKIQLINSANLCSRQFGSISFAQKSNNIFGYGSNQESSIQWTKNTNNTYSLQNNLTGFIYNQVPDASKITEQTKSSLGTQQLNQSKIFSLDFQFGPIFANSPIANQPFPNFSLGNSSFNFNLFGTQAQQQLLRSLKQSQIIDKQGGKTQKQKNDQR